MCASHLPKQSVQLHMSELNVLTIVSVMYGNGVQAVVGCLIGVLLEYARKPSRRDLQAGVRRVLENSILWKLEVLFIYPSSPINNFCVRV
jgi:hypothetical protein